uniref:Uncharacterized protein n=1 Tax=Anguilla anguilla TaxID=7936 RepID=A0A0E9TY12_ANGAN
MAFLSLNILSWCLCAQCPQWNMESILCQKYCLRRKNTQRVGKKLTRVKKQS